MRVDDEVEVTLAVTLFGVGEGVVGGAVLFLHDGQGAHRLAQQRELLDVDADGAGLRGEHEALHTDDVADVQFLENGIVHRFVLAGTDFVAFHIYLDFTDRILQLIKGDCTHNALAHNASRKTHILEKGVVGRKFLQNLLAGDIHLVKRCRISIYTKIRKIVQFLSTDNLLF